MMDLCKWQKTSWQKIRYNSVKVIIAFLKDKDYRNLLISSFSMLAIGTFCYHHLEGWTWIDSLYFSFISLTTVGFGDITPKTDIGKIFTIFYLTIGIGLILTFIDILFKHYSDHRKL